ncbi:putative ATPase [Streptosporangium album]|uniref:Putative ATPase n=1 Tax=Streptosporangium album TaxID=47479 RepID=A0A7W7RWL2_9ACTN|nr:AAA family ATPase [Streptosporangium album]MBB4939561.1 putative ATPase [Streptosporangium album]
METTFVGRHAEIAQVARLMRESRLVTLTGLGGVGKTRLARRVAEEIVEEFPDGFWTVELACLTDPHLLAETVAGSMGLADQSARRQEEALAEWLAPRRALLMLDTCEHLVEAVASLVDTLLRGAPHLRVLTAGRQPLGVPGEHVYSVPPLPVEDAVVLLRDRAGPASAPDGPVETRGGGGDGAADMAELCRRLDCIPLAIEMAAVHLRTLPPTLLLRRLDDRYHLLTGGGGPVRHESLRAAMGWSHELCTPAERLLWARLSVFAAGFDLEAAEHVCAGGPLPAGQVLEALTGLADKSLVQREEHPTGVRLRMLDTVREFGAEWLLRLGEDDAVRGRHRDHYLRLARRCATEWPGRQAEWYGRIRAERRNLRKVVDLCLADPEWSRAALDLTGTLWFLWICCGMPGEGRHYLEAALRTDTEPGPERLRALWVCAWVAALQGDLDVARERLDRCRAEDTEGSATGHVAQVEGMLSLLRGDHPRAIELLDEAMAWHMAKGSVLSGLLPCHTLVALALLAEGRPEEAVETLSEGQALCEVHGEEWSRAQMEYVFAWAGHVRGETPEALRHARSALVSALLFEDLSLSVACVEMIAWAVAEEGHAGGGAWLLGAAQAVRESSGLSRSGSTIFASIRARAATRAAKALGGAGFDTLFAEGQGSDLGIAVKYALGEKFS